MAPAESRTTSSLTINAGVGELAAVRAFVRRRCAEMGAGPDAIADVVQAVDEAVTNVIIHGYRGRDGMIEIAIVQESPSLMAVIIRDAGPGFDPATVPAPDPQRPLEARLGGGMGVYLMREAMDEIRHRVLPDGRNELTMTRRIDRGE